MPTPRPSSVSPRLRSILSGSLVGALVALHGWALARRLADGTLLEPVVLGKWLASLGLVGLVWGLRATTREPLGRRRLVVLWTLVLLVHALGAAPPLTGVGAALQQAPISALGLLALPASLAAEFVVRPAQLLVRFLERLGRLSRAARAVPLLVPLRARTRFLLAFPLRCLPDLPGPLARRPPPAFVLFSA